MLVKRAEEFARLVHCNQTYGGLPYYAHLKEVYLTLVDFGVTDESILAASWLHDSLEDTETTYETLLIQFGKEVADLVQAVTNEKGTNRREVLEKTAPKIVDNEKALVIKLADRIVNTEFSLENNPKLYKMYKKEFPMFKGFLYSKTSTKYFIPLLWEYLETLYSDETNFEEELPRYSILEKKEISDEWAMHLIEYREEVREAEREKKEEEYWSRYNQLLDEREVRYYDDCYQIVEERMYDL